MYYCEKCNAAFEYERCPVCGNKKTREPRDDDFCFFAEQAKRQSEVLMSVLDANDIPYSAVPYGTGAESIFGMSLSYNRLYVPFGCLEKAKDILQEIEAENTEKLRTLLLENVHLFNISPKAEKKIRKKIKLSPDVDFMSFCIDIVKSAKQIKDEAYYTTSERLLSCYSDDYIVSFLSNKFVIDTVIRKK